MSAGGELEARLRAAVEALPRGLRDHTLRVEAEALRLASLYDVEPERARIAALGHDLVRHKPDAELLALAAEYAVEPDEVERAAPVMVHGPVAARLLLRDYALTDPEILAGIDCHTTGRPGMSRLEKVLLVADKIEPGKLGRGDAWREVRSLADHDLDAALLRYIDLRLDEALREGLLISERYRTTRNQLLLARGPNEHRRDY